MPRGEVESGSPSNQQSARQIAVFASQGSSLSVVEVRAHLHVAQEYFVTQAGLVGHHALMVDREDRDAEVDAVLHRLLEQIERDHLGPGCAEQVAVVDAHARDAGGAELIDAGCHSVSSSPRVAGRVPARDGGRDAKYEANGSPGSSPNRPTVVALAATGA